MASPIPERPSGGADPASLGDDGTLTDGAALKKRALFGVFALIARTALQELAVLGGNIYLARKLGPAEFGAFWIVQFALSFFTLFGDAGLGAALIQKQERPTDEELSSVWWLQAMLSLGVIAAVFVCAPWVVKLWPDLPHGSEWLLRALAFQLLLTSLRVVPSILMERELFFGRLSVIDLMLTLTFYGSACILAGLDYGTFALVAAVLIQGAAGLLLTYAFRPWLPSLSFRPELLRPILKFGMLFQAKTVVGFVNGATIPLFAGTMLGRYELGLVTWSQNTAFFPMKLVEILGRVNFPLLARMQHDRRAFARTLEQSIQICAVVTFFFVALFVGLGPSIVAVAFGDRWIPAIPTLYVFAVVLSIGFLSPIIGGALDAIGKPAIGTRLAVGWTALNWVVVVSAMHLWRTALSFSLAYSVHVVVGNLVVIMIVKRLVPDARFFPRLRAGVLAAAVTGVVNRWLLQPWSATGPAPLVGSIVVSAAMFLAVLALFDRSAVRELASLFRRKEGAPPGPA